jgi:hypothetical protein
MARYRCPVRARPLALPVIVGLAGCSPDAEPAARTTDGAGPDSAEVDTRSPADPIEARARLVRLSMQLAGRRPDAAWLLAADDPDTFEAAFASLLADPAFGARVAWAWNRELHLAAFGEDISRWNDMPALTRRSLNWEPLAGIARIVEEDRPFSEMGTAQEWPVNGTLASFQGRSHVGASGEWSWSPYEDGRPMGGILSTAGLWARHAADATNEDRRRGNLVARVFVCADFLERDVVFALPDFTDLGDGAAERVAPECTTCHAALDPMSAPFAGFGNRSNPTPLAEWLTWSEDDAEFAAAATTPAWYGHPARNVAEIGELLAADPRFARCVTRRTYEWLTEASFDEAPEREALVAAFVDGGLHLPPLVRAVVATDAWAAPVTHVASAEQLATSLSEAYALPAGDWGVWPALEDGLFEGELRAMTGDTDDEQILQPDLLPASGMQFATDWMTRSAAADAVAADLARAPADRLLLPDGDADEDVKAAMAGLWLRILSREVSADGEEVGRLFTLYTDSGRGAEGWETVLIALGRHPDVSRF